MDAEPVGLALCPGTGSLIGFQQPNWFSVLNTLSPTWGNEVSEPPGEGSKIQMLVLSLCFIPCLILSGNQFVMFPSEQGICVTKQSAVKRPVGDISFRTDGKCK